MHEFNELEALFTYITEHYPQALRIYNKANSLTEKAPADIEQPFTGATLVLNELESLLHEGISETN